MEIREELKKIEEEIQGRTPAFKPDYAIEALENTNVYLFRYFPKLKMIVLTERLCRDFHVKPVYQDMPYSFSEDFVSDHDRDIFEQMYHDIDAGAPSASANFRGKNQMAWCHVTLTTVEWDEDHNPELCTGVVEDRTQEETTKEELGSILASISCGILQYRKSDNQLLRANKAALEILGYSSLEELVDDRENGVVRNVIAEDRRHIAELVSELKGPGDIRTVEYRVRHKGSDQLRYCYGTVQLYNDVHGEPVVLRSIMDITDRKIKEDVQNTNQELVQRLQKGTEELSHLLTMQRQMMASLSCGVLAYTLPQHEMLIVNKEAKRIFRYDDSNPKSIIETVFDHILPEDYPVMSSAVKTLKKVGDSCTYKLHPQREDGTRLTVECNSKLRAFKDGQQFILSVISDITSLEERTDRLNQMNKEQKKMLTEIRRERQQYRDALVSGSEYAYRIDLTEGMVSADFDYSIRGNLEENLGIKAPVSFDAMAQRWLELMKPVFLTPEDQNPMTTEQVMECYREGHKHIITEYFNTAENKYYRRNLLLSEDEETGHVGAIAIVSDITDIMREETRKRNELALMNLDLQKQIGISQAFSSIYFATWEVNLNSLHMRPISVPDWAGPIQRESKGDFKSASELMISTFVKEESKDAIRGFMNIDDMAERLKNESMLSCEYIGQHYGWTTACLIPCMRDEDGSVTRVIFALREISNEKRIEIEAKQALEEAYEAANRANAAKTEFLASMSHDIRTPMNGIIGMTAIAGTHLDDKERVADCLTKISIASKHLLGLINEVLDMNKIESGKLDLSVEEFSLPDLLDALLVMSKAQIESKRHELSVNIYNVEHEKVIGDSLRIQQVFINLLSNAIKYTPHGGKIQLSLTEKTTNNPKIGCFEFVVEDNGIGMSPEFQERLFEPFSRAKDQRVEKIQGSGLGMPIAQNIVHMMNGDIQVESKLGEGTKFTVTIYLELQEPDDSVSIEDFIDLPILVADDDPVACESTCAVLTELGMNGEWVLTGEQALLKTVERHEEHRDYFAVILDWKMPDMDGLETAKAIRHAVGNEVPIIIISAYDWSDIEQEARAAGVNAFISKPVFKSRISYLFKSLLGHGHETSPASVMKDLSEVDCTGKRALLAEDNELNAEIAMELLGITGLELEHALDGKEAVDLFNERPEGYYDIVFMDIQMPIMTGYEAARAIRALPSTYGKTIPILAMTANAFAEDVQAAKKAGMNEHIAKPLNIGQLAKALERWIK